MVDLNRKLTSRTRLRLAMVVAGGWFAITAVVSAQQPVVIKGGLAFKLPPPTAPGPR